MMEVLHSGYDGFDCSFMAAMPPAFLSVLSQAKAQAEAASEPQLIEFAGHHMHVHPTGAPGGYRYRCDTGPEGETWFFKHSENREGWNVRVSGKSLPLALYAVENVRNNWLAMLRDWGIEAQQESVGRLDYCVDLVMNDDFTLDPHDFVFSSRTKLAAHRDDACMRDEHKGRRCESVTIGKMPRRQVIVYDKTAEIRARRKPYWREIWGLSPDDDRTVWRFEFRAGKEHLKEDWKVTTFKQLMRKLPEIMGFATEVVRMVTGDDQNVTRRPVHPVWAFVAGILQKALGTVSGVKPERVRQTRRESLKATCEALIIGCAASLAVARGYRAHESHHVLGDLGRLVRAFSHENSRDWRDKVQRAWERHHFLSPSEARADPRPGFFGKGEGLGQLLPEFRGQYGLFNQKGMTA